MSSVFFDLYFRASDERRKSGSVWITGKKYLGESHGLVTLSHDCGSVSELEVVIKQMHADLEDVLRRAKLKFDAADRELNTTSRHRWYRF